ncbi:MAG: hypothetical protein KF785_02525 [Gemmatimonadales bacterium]|nr:hypothetical protein [Gemmatimonadales bacterium]
MTIQQFRMGLAVVGFGLAALGAATANRTIVWVAMAALIISLLIRIYLRGKEP